MKFMWWRDHKKALLFLLAFQRWTHLPYLLTNSMDHSGYGLSQWETVHFVILSLTGWAHTQNDLHNHSGNMDSVNERQHYLKPSLNLAGATPRMITAVYGQLLSFNHILNIRVGARHFQNGVLGPINFWKMGSRLENWSPKNLMIIFFFIFYMT